MFEQLSQCRTNNVSIQTGFVSVVILTHSYKICGAPVRQTYP